MSDVLGAGGGGRKPSPAMQTCEHCGGFVAPMNVLDTRQDKNYRLLRCISCEKLSWSEEQTWKIVHQKARDAQG